MNCSTGTPRAESYYVDPAGAPTNEVREVKLVVRALREVYGNELAAELSSLRVKAARQKWIDAGLARSECNPRVNLIRRIAKWAAGDEPIPAQCDRFAPVTICGVLSWRLIMPVICQV